MKKHILLTTTAMLLSAITLNANADSNSTQLEVQAVFVKPMELISEKYLGFGTLLAGEANKTVIIKNDGTLDSSSTATILSKASYENDDNGSLNEGVIRIKGALNNDDIDGTGEDFLPITEDAMKLIFAVDISPKEIELKSQTDSVTCGTVTGFNTNMTAENNDMLIHVGGTLTTENLSGATRALVCKGYTTVTLVINEDNYANVMNSQ